MSNPKNVEEAAEARRHRATAEYFVGVWRGDGPEAVLSLAQAAGRTAAEAQADLNVAARARTLIQEADRLADARRRLARAEAERMRAEQRLEAASLKLLPRVQEATAAAEEARRKVDEADAAAREVLRLSRERPELIPRASLPPAVGELLEIEKRDAQRRDLHRCWVQAKEAVEAAEAAVREARESLANLVMTVTYERDRAVGEKRVAEAEEALRAARAAYIKVDRAAAEAEA